MPRDMHDVWLKHAELFGYQMSKDPEFKVGACVVSMNNRQVSFGYNGFPRGADERSDAWEDKHGRVIHAELNAILNAEFNTAGCKLYCSTIPCHVCLGQAINAGITHVYYVTPIKTFSIINYDIWNEYSRLFVECKDSLQLNLERDADECSH